MPKDRLVTEGELGDSLFIVASGQLLVEKMDRTGRPRQINRLGPGDCFGEIALLGAGERSATVVAETEAEVFELSRRTLAVVSRRFTSVKQRLTRLFQQRLINDLGRNSMLFMPFDRAQRRQLLSKFQSVQIQRGRRIVEEGKRSNGLYLIFTGRCDVHRRQGKKRILLDELRAGDCFGGISLLADRPAVATVTARVDSVLLRLSPPAYTNLIGEQPAFRDRMRDVATLRAERYARIVSGADQPQEEVAAADLTGDLAEMSLFSLVSFLELERLSGVLYLNQGKQRAKLFVRSGQVVDVEDPLNLPGPIDSLTGLASWEWGEFRFKAGSVDRKDRIGVRTTALLMDLSS